MIVKTMIYTAYESGGGMKEKNTDLIEIKKIIDQHIEEQNPHDNTYIRRLRHNRQALMMSHWTTHFESTYMLKCPAVQGKILDFGCGSGHMDILLGRQNKTIRGIDLSPIAIGIANYFKSLEPLVVQDRVSFEQKDICQPPTDEVRFDTIISTHVFEHIPTKDLPSIIQGLKMHSKPNALMIVSVPIGYAYDDPDHVHHFMTPKELRNHFEPFVNVERIFSDKRNQVFKGFFNLRK